MNRNLTIIVALLLLMNPALAQHNEAVSEAHSSSKKNIVGLFAGSTYITPSGYNLPTFGIEYVRELNHVIGIGLIAEIEAGTHIIEEEESGAIIAEVEREGAFLLLPAIYARLYKGLILSAGYGVEFEKTENLGLLKVSLEYKLNLKNNHWLVLPTLSWDNTKLFNGWVYGVNFAYVF